MAAPLLPALNSLYFHLQNFHVRNFRVKYFRWYYNASIRIVHDVASNVR